MDPLIKSYQIYNDKQLVNLILQGKEEAAIYLLYHKCYKIICKLVYLVFGSCDYREEMISDLYLHLKEPINGEYWHRLNSFKGEAGLNTWLYKVSYNLFIEKRKKMIGFSRITIQLNEVNQQMMANLPAEEDRLRHIELYDAIFQLNDNKYKIVLLMELQGYTSEEIANSLPLITSKEGKKIKVSVDYVYNQKSKAIKELRKIYKKELL